MIKLTRGERFKDARIVHNQHKKQTMDEVAAATGVSKSLIQSLEDDTIKRSVGYDKVAKLAAHYHVTTDYLLGLTDDHSIQPCATDDLGLSESSIESIRFYAEDSGDALRGLDLLLNSHDFWGVCLTVERLRKSVAALSNEEHQVIDLATQHNLEKDLIAIHPELKDKIQVLYGDLLLSAMSKKANDFFNMAVNDMTGLSKRHSLPMVDNKAGTDNDAGLVNHQQD